MAKNKEVLRLGRFERKKIEKRRDQESDKRIFRRLSALLGLDDGCSQEEVARFLGTTARTVRRWKNIYRSRWLLRGQRFHVGVGGGRKRLNILGAISPEDHEYLDVRVSKENLNAKKVIRLLRKMHRAHPEVKKFIIYLDNARYHHAVLAKAWISRMKKNALSDWHTSFEAMQQAVANVLDHLGHYADELKTLLPERFQLWPDEAWQTCPTE